MYVSLFIPGAFFDSRHKRHLTHLEVGLAGYEITVYPSNDLYVSFVTDTPRNICLIVVLIVAFTALVVSLYGYLIKIREDKIKELIKHSFAEAKSRDAVFLAKRVYVRYMSHEMRTPLNVMHLGLKILEKNLLKSRLHSHKTQVATVRDIMSACDIAVAFLNDLLNFGKLEDGFLEMKPTKTSALTFITSTSRLFVQKAEEKRISIVFDFGPTADLSSSCVSMSDITSKFDVSDLCASHSKTETKTEIERDYDDEKQGRSWNYLRKEDYIFIDELKMAQVVRNMISNAIQYTPIGGTVRIEARKVLHTDSPLQIGEPEMNKHVSSKSNENLSLRSESSIDHYVRKWTKKMSNIHFHRDEPNTSRDDDLELGSRSINKLDYSGKVPEILVTTSEELILNVIDSGVGMSPEESEEILGKKEELDPSMLQV